MLPADHLLERADIGVPWSGERYIVFGNTVAEPPFDGKHDYSWLSRVAERLGVGEVRLATANLRQVCGETPTLAVWEALGGCSDQGWQFFAEGTRRALWMGRYRPAVCIPGAFSRQT